MNTAEKLEAITHAGDFELLVTSVLSNHNKDYAAIIHPGINALGETTKSPVDGFCLVPGSKPPRFLFVAHTKSDRNSLKNKWLYDHRTTRSSTKAKKASVTESDDGDLLKAGREAQELKNDFPDAQFTVILTTNQRLSKCIAVVNEVYKKARELGVEVEIWEQSRLARILDSTIEGQWLRKEYLGIPAEMLSKSLLGDLCEQSLANYEKQFLTSPNSWVSREIESEIEKGTHSNTYTIQLLIGESGSGKSAAAYQILKKHLASGGYGLWVSDELLRECTSLETALDRVLRDFYPSLLPDAGRVAVRLIPEGSRLLLIVDDVNRANNPTRQVENLVNWSKPKQSGTSDSQPVFSLYLVVCPVWSKISSSISPDFRETSWVNTVFIGSMTPAEGIAAVKATTSDLTSTEATSLATKLGSDPILIGLFSALLSNTQVGDLDSLSENVIERFITTTINEASSSPNTSQKNECVYEEALSTLATHMLKNRKRYPFRKEIRNWLRESPDEFAALEELTGQKKLCRFTRKGKFDFRHDRIREALLVKSMIELLADTTSADSDILYEPFYAEIIGQAIARSPQSKEFLRELRNRLPLALVQAIRCFGTPTTDYHQTIIEEVKEWVNNSVATGFIPESVLDAVCWSLLEINSPAVIEITDNFPAYRPVLLARLRNGCAVSGVRDCLNQSQFCFSPFSQDKLRNQALEQAKRYHKEKLIKQLKQLLVSHVATDQERAGTLTLAGFICFSELEDEIATCWELVTEKKLVLFSAIWAATQCCGAEPKKLLDPLMEYWAKLADKENPDNVFLEDWFVHRLSWPLAPHGIRDHVINYLIAQCNVHKPLRWPIIVICESIDTPDAIDFIVRSAADIERRIAGTEEVSFWTIELPSNWNGSRKLHKLSLATLERLRCLWQNPANDEFLKSQAFRLWLTGIESEQIDILRGISSDSVLFRYALWRRAQFGDCSTIPDLLPFLSESRWFYVAHHVWCEEIKIRAQHHLAAFKDNIPTNFLGGWLFDHISLSRLLSRIPVQDAEILLEQYWDHLGYSCCFIQTALYVGTSRCLELAASSISQCPANIPIFKNLFEHLKSHYGFTFTSSDWQEPWTVKCLENLMPYLDRLDESQIWQLNHVCCLLDNPEWSQRHLLPRLSEEHRKSVYPLDDDLLEELNKFAVEENSEWRVRHWLDGRYISKSRALTLVDCWLAFNPTIKGLQIAAACIKAVGTRNDLSILEQYQIEGSPDEIARIKESTRFAVYRRSLH